MAAPVIQVDYQALEKIAFQFADQQKRVRSILQTAQTSTDQLRRGGWIAEAATTFYRDMDQNVLPAVQRLEMAMQNSQRTVQEIIRLMHAAEEEAKGYLNDTQVSSHFLTAWLKTGGEERGIEFKNFPYHLIKGAEGKGYFGLLAGNMTPEQIKEFLTKDPLKTSALDYVDLKANLLEGDVSGGIAAWEGQISGDWGNASLNVLSLEGKAGYELGLGKDGLQAKINAEVGAYLAHGTVNANIAGMNVAADGYIGANAHGEAGIVVNPINGDVKVKAEGEAFIGGKAGVQAQTDLSAVGLPFIKVGGQGYVSAGAGVEGKIDVGFDKGVLKFEMGGGGAVGLGGGGGVNVELDVGKAGEAIMDFGKDVLGLSFPF